MTTREALTEQIQKMGADIGQFAYNQSLFADGTDAWRAYNTARNTLENRRDDLRRILADLED